MRSTLLKLCYLAILASIFIIPLADVYASDKLFDGKRKGFILGIGITPQVNIWKNTYASDINRSYSFGIQIKPGYGFSENILLYNTSSLGTFSVEKYQDHIGVNMSGGIGLMCYPISIINLYMRGEIRLSGGISEMWREMNVGIEGAMGYELLRHLTFDISLHYERYWYDSDSSVRGPLIYNQLSFSITMTGLFY